MNIVFFYPDELRADCLGGAYGHRFIQTPNYNRLSEEGVTFTDCHVQHTVCSPQRCALFTGWYPHVRGHRTLWHLLRPDEPNLFAYLKRAGYRTYAFGKNDLLAQASFAHSVDEFYDFPGGIHGRNAYAYGEDEYFSFIYTPFEGSAEETTDMRCVARAIEVIRNQKADDPPYCIFLPLGNPHPPFSAPEPFHSMYHEDEVTLRSSEWKGKPALYNEIRRYRGLDNVDERMLRKARAIYLGMTSYTDMMLGRLLDAIDEKGDETSVIVSSDHGEWAGDYGLVEKWPSALDDTLTRVPLIIRTPTSVKGHVVTTPVEAFDVMATTLSLAGVSAKHTHFSRDLSPCLAGDAGDANRVIYTEGGYDVHEPHAFEGFQENLDSDEMKRMIYTPKHRQQQEMPETVARAVAARTREHKLIRRSGGDHELYDLARDPEELVNVYDEAAYKDVRTALEDTLLSWYLRTSDVVPYNRDPRNFT